MKSFEVRNLFFYFFRGVWLLVCSSSYGIVSTFIYYNNRFILKVLLKDFFKPTHSAQHIEPLSMGIYKFHMLSLNNPQPNFMLFDDNGVSKILFEGYEERSEHEFRCSHFSDNPIYRNVLKNISTCSHHIEAPLNLLHSSKRCQLTFR